MILANLFTKPLQGSLVWRLIEVIMVWLHVEILQDYVLPPKKEQVENYVSGDESEILHKATYSHIITGGGIRKTDGS